MQSPPFSILGINNNHPCQPSNPPPGKQDNRGQQQLQQIQPILITNPTNRASRHRGEGGEGEEGEPSKAATITKKWKTNI